MSLCCLARFVIRQFFCPNLSADKPQLSRHRWAGFRLVSIDDFDPDEGRVAAADGEAAAAELNGDRVSQRGDADALHCLADQNAHLKQPHGHRGFTGDFGDLRTVTAAKLVEGKCCVRDGYGESPVSSYSRLSLRLNLNNVVCR